MTKHQYSTGDLVRVTQETLKRKSYLKLPLGVQTIESISISGYCLVSGWLLHYSNLEPATPPDEIERHGVMYVRKDGAGADTARLDWLEATRATLQSPNVAAWIVSGSNGIATLRTNPRRAIDVAMRDAIDAAITYGQEQDIKSPPPPEELLRRIRTSKRNKTDG